MIYSTLFKCAEHINVFPFSSDYHVRNHSKEHGSISLLRQDVGRWFPQYLREEASLGKTQVFNFDVATDILLAVLTGHFLVKLTGIGTGIH